MTYPAPSPKRAVVYFKTVAQGVFQASRVCTLDRDVKKDMVVKPDVVIVELIGKRRFKTYFMAKSTTF